MRTDRKGSVLRFIQPHFTASLFKGVCVIYGVNDFMTLSDICLLWGVNFLQKFLWF